jgi:hypothetical protein
MGMALAAVLGAAALFWRSILPGRAGASPVSARMEIRGEPIDPAAGMTKAAPGAASAERPGKKRHPKPSSFQKRMVEYQVGQAGGAGSNGFQPYAGAPAKTIWSRAQLLAMPSRPLPAGFERVGFDVLSGFDFNVTKAMADGSANPALASALTAAAIPAPVKALDNRVVAVRGFLLPLRMEDGLAVEFLLMRDQNLCCFGAVPKITEWITVRVAGQGMKPVMDQPVSVMGKLRVGEIRENGYLAGIYRIDNATGYAEDKP